MDSPARLWTFTVNVGAQGDPPYLVQIVAQPEGERVDAVCAECDEDELYIRVQQVGGASAPVEPYVECANVDCGRAYYAV